MIRLCEDYIKVTNKYMEIDKYPIPRVEDLVSNFQVCVKLINSYRQMRKVKN